MGLDIHAVSNLRYARPLPGGEESDRLEEEVNRPDTALSLLLL